MAADPQRATGDSAPPVSPRKSSELPARIAASLAMMALALAAVWAGAMWFMLFWLIAFALVNWEWQGLIGGGGRALRVMLGNIVLAAAAVLAISGEARDAIIAALVGAALASIGFWRRPWPAGGVLYAAAPLIAVCVLRSSEEFGARSILWLFALVWGVDVTAYFGGRLIGGPKLWPRVSPGKTWSGFIVGIACGAAISILLAPPGGAKFALFALALVGGAIAQGGDLFESAIKRRFGAKDSSHLIPGHGGLMDRLDGFIAAAIFAALFGVARGGLAHAARGLLLW
ncbi:MAG TPA: phosphatidate cytidylyltransferase [Roseiarcus sp.]|nr:phosphatidate cytidylyltransferase [Roseiarcus sp.]